LEAPDSTTLTEKTPRRINPEQVPLAFWPQTVTCNPSQARALLSVAKPITFAKA
jgi:hypothetical protein